MAFKMKRHLLRVINGHLLSFVVNGGHLLFSGMDSETGCLMKKQLVVRLVSQVIHGLEYV